MQERKTGFMNSKDNVLFQACRRGRRYCFAAMLLLVGLALARDVRAQDQAKLPSQPEPGPQAGVARAPLEGAEIKSQPVLKIEPLTEPSSAKARAGSPSTLTITRERLTEPALLPSGDERARELSRAMQNRLGSTVSPAEARSLLNAGSRQTPEKLATMKNAGRAVLDADRARLGGPQLAAPARLSANDLDKHVPRKLAVAPLPSAPPKPVVDCEKNSRIDELRAKAAAETEPASRDRLLLVLAGNHVGQGDWQAAKTIYDQLAATSNDPAVLEAVRRNLLVVDKKLEALGETDPGRKERLELDLAAIHHDLGHEQASKRICRELVKTARDETVREEAVRLHNTTDQPTQLPAPPGATPPGQDKTGKTGASGKGGAQ